MNELDQLAAELDPAFLAYLHSLGATLEAARAVQQFASDWCEYRAEPPGEDDWQSPSYTLAHRTMDCEDAAILKLALLRLAGIPLDDLSLVYGKRCGAAHVVCNVTISGETYTLDIDRITTAGDALPLEVLAYTRGALPEYESGAWSDRATDQWRGKVEQALGVLS